MSDESRLAEESPQRGCTLSVHSIVKAADNQVSTVLDDEVVLLQTVSGIYYGLNAVGARIWSIIQEERRVDDVLQILLDEYAVEPAECERELLGVLSDLKAAGLVDVSSG